MTAICCCACCSCYCCYCYRVCYCLPCCCCCRSVWQCRCMSGLAPVSVSVCRCVSGCFCSSSCCCCLHFGFHFSFSFSFAGKLVACTRVVPQKQNNITRKTLENSLFFFPVLLFCVPESVCVFVSFGLVGQWVSQWWKASPTLTAPPPPRRHRNYL